MNNLLYPEKLTSYLKKRIASKAIAKQFIASELERNSQGTKTPFEEGKGAFGIYGVERLYKDRLIIMPSMSCPAHCRFCYRKDRVMNKKREMTYEEIDRAAKEIAKRKEIRGVLITGGDPFMNVEKLLYLLEKLSFLENIFEIRIGTRSFLMRPDIFTKNLAKKIASFQKVNTNDPKKSKSLAINVHFNHPDEITKEAIEAAHLFSSRGIILRNQAVLLKDINDTFQDQKALNSILLRNNILPYYLSHCDPVIGSDHMRTSVAKGLEIYEKLARESTTALPFYIIDMPVGKMRLFPGIKLKYKTINNKRYVEIVTSYLAKDFRETTKKELPHLHEETKDGYIKGYYLDGE